jgi:uncharacterized NAD(P)/FAD-binding protein YdhS
VFFRLLAPLFWDLGELMLTDSTRCIAIVGAGFCGTITAVNLLREAHVEPLRILLIDRERHARGTAYAAHPHPYLLNVPAGRMSALSSEPLDFVHYAQRTVPTVTAEDFLPRAVYGNYLEETLSEAERCAPAHVRLERVRGTVCSVDLVGPEQSFMLGFQDGREITATEVVLALGNPPPAQLRGADALRGSPRLVEDPWSSQGTFRPDETVLLVGTGLTMADIAVSAMQGGRGPARIYALSRHGLVPPRQTAFRNAHSEFDPLPLLHAASFSMHQLFRLVRQICRDAEQRGGDWREAITFVRTLVPRLWSRLPVRERKRFLRHVRVYWDIHRHRLPVTTRNTIDELRDAQRLVVRAGQVLLLQPEADRVRVTWQPRGQDRPATLRVDRVINCTGPDYRCGASRDPLVHDLMTKGLIQPDALATGLRTTPTGAVLNALGRPTRGLYYVGPLLRADHWEATAVHELREHAESLAQQLTLPVLARAAGLGIR